MKRRALHLTVPIFGMSFLFSWILWGTLILLTRSGVIQQNGILYMILFIFGGLGPTIMPLALIWVLLPRQEALKLVTGRLFRFRTPWYYYAAAAGLTILYVMLHLLLSRYFYGWNRYMAGRSSWFTVLALFPVMIIGGGLEEVGWRGIGVPELFARFRPALGSIILGIIWMAWHVPLFLLPGTSQHGSDLISFFAMGFGFSLILAALMYFSRTAVPCIIAHALFNALYGTGWMYPVEKVSQQRIIDIVLLAAGVAIFMLWSTLETRRHTIGQASWGARGHEEKRRADPE